MSSSWTTNRSTWSPGRRAGTATPRPRRRSISVSTRLTKNDATEETFERSPPLASIEPMPAIVGALIWLGDGEAHVYRWPDNALISSFATPWTAAQIGAVDWIQIGDTVLLAHQAHPIQQIQRQLDGTFTTALYAFDFAPAGRIQPPPLRLHATALSGTTLMTSLDGPVFRPAYSTLGLAAPKVDRDRLSESSALRAA